jgi:ribosomal protein L19E
MNLRKKKELASKTLKVGKNRIIINKEGLDEIKEAITKQDILSLYQGGIIYIKPVKGRRKIIKRKTKKGAGKIKMKVKNRKTEYVRITRKLRGHLKNLKNKGEIDREFYLTLRKKIKLRGFKSLGNLKEYILTTKQLGDKNANIKIGNKKKRTKKKTGGRNKK